MNNLQTRREMTLDDIRAKVPSVFQTQPFSGVSERYEFISTAEVVEKLMNEGFKPFAAMEQKVRNASKVGFSKHCLRFRHDSLLPSIGTEIPELVLVNSHDRTSAYTLQIGIFRIVCSNGLIVCSEQFEKISVKHIGDQANKVLEGSFKIIENMPVVMNQINDWKGITLDNNTQLEYAQSAITAVKPKLEYQAKDLLIVNRFGDLKNDLYTTFNRVQENLLKGGLLGKSENGKFRHGKAIKGMTADRQLNETLWQLTENTHKQLLLAA